MSTIPAPKGRRGKRPPGGFAHVPKEGRRTCSDPRGTAARSFRAGFAASWPVPSWLWSLSTVSDVLSVQSRYVARDISPLHVTGWSIAWPILPSQSQRLEEDIKREERNKVPILDPIPTEFAPAACLDPPSEEEVWNKVPKFKNGCPPFYETQRNNVRILIEKIGEKIDPCKVYPLAGPCQLVHCHYKCTVYYDELYWSDYPIPFNHVDHKVEVVYFDKDHLRRCGGPEQAATPPL